MGKILKRIEVSLFYVFLFSTPFQTRVILKLWGTSFNEWTASFLYATDILLVALFVLWLIRRGEFKFGGWADFSLLALIGFSALSLVRAPVVELGLYQLIKLVEMTLLYFYIKSNFKVIFNIEKSFFVLVLAGILQAAIAVIQFFKQSSLGLKIFGESLLSPDVYGVAAFKVMGDLVLRAYGTFPHPNVLAAFLFIAVFVSYFLFLNDKDDKRFWLLYANGLILAGLIFSFSRLVVLLWVVGIVLRVAIMAFLKKSKTDYLGRYRKRLIYLSIVTVVASSVIYGFHRDIVNARLKFSTSEEAYVQRVFYNKKSVKSYSLLGNGVGNFIPWLKVELPSMPAKNYQPVHNIYLLMLTEIGILGLASFLVFVVLLSIQYFKKIPFTRPFHHSFYILFTSFLVIGVFDHYLWTLQQGRLMFWLLLGLTAALVENS